MRENPTINQTGAQWAQAMAAAETEIGGRIESKPRRPLRVLPTMMDGQILWEYYGDSWDTWITHCPIVRIPNNDAMNITFISCFDRGRYGKKQQQGTPGNHVYKWWIFQLLLKLSNMTHFWHVIGALPYYL